MCHVCLARSTMYSKYPLLTYSLVLQMVRIFMYFLSVPSNMIFNQPATPSNVDKREGDVPKVSPSLGHMGCPLNEAKLLIITASQMGSTRT